MSKQTKSPQNAFYAQSGGVTAVINASAAGVIETARKYPHRIGKVYAGRDGIIGALTEDLIDTSQERPSAIAALKHTPSGAFGSCRYKLKSINKSRRQYKRLIDVFAAHNIGYFFYNGGGDSADTCLKISQLSRQLGFPITAIHIPKTVDNDLPITDNCPGFGSVAKYIAISTREASFDVASMARTSTKVFVIEVMGRHTGWIAAAGAMAADDKTPLPIITLFPEVPFSRRAFIAAVKRKIEEFGYVSVVVAEGVRDRKERFLADQGLTDAFGHAQLGGVAPVIANLIKQKLGYKFHWAVADYLQRAARHIASKTDVDQAYAVGRAAVQLALGGKNSVMVTIIRSSDKPYRWKTGSTPLSRVANREKMLPANFITKDGFGITEKCRRYLRPLLKGEDYPPYQDGLPVYVRLQNTPVKKKLAKKFKLEPSVSIRRPPKASAQAEGYSTHTGFRNRNNQTNCGKIGWDGKGHLQKIYAMRCENCGFCYGANGADAYQRKCPNCQRGKNKPIASCSYPQCPVKPAKGNCKHCKSLCRQVPSAGRKP